MEPSSGTAPAREAAELQAIPSVPECTLPADLHERLPESTAGAPWDCRMEALTWVHRSTPAAADVLPPGLEAGRGLTVAMLVRYLDTPVGPYNEILASPMLVRGGLLRGHVPFIAVDSVTSVHGGRAHWALPKVLARFEGSPLAGEPLRVDGDGWWVSARPAGVGPFLPMLMRLSCVQVRGSGEAINVPLAMRGRARLARAKVDVDPGSSLAALLRPGPHLAALVKGRMSVGVPSPAA